MGERVDVLVLKGYHAAGGKSVTLFPFVKHMTVNGIVHRCCGPVGFK